jgi:hypothetical protein
MHVYTVVHSIWAIFILLYPLPTSFSLPQVAMHPLPPILPCVLQFCKRKKFLLI